MQRFTSSLRLLFIVLGLASAHVSAAQAPTVAPSRLIVEPLASTTYNQNTTRIHWTRGTGAAYIVLIRYVDQYTGNPVPALVEPDDRPYATTGNYLMDASSYVPKNPLLGTPTPVSTTYLLKTATYGSAADTTAQVLNTTIGNYYEVTVFEYNSDAAGNKYYVRSQPQLFRQARLAPQITGIALDALSQPVVTFQTRAEYLTSFFKVQWATDSTQLTSALGSSFQVAPSPALPGTLNTYTATLPTSGTQPLYYRVVLTAETRPLLTEIVASRAVRYAPAPQLTNVTTLSATPSAGAGATINLAWTAATEFNNAGFRVQRSADTLTWQTLGFVASRGNSTVPTAYAYQTANLGAAYYRVQALSTTQQVTGTSPIRFVGAGPLAAAAQTEPHLQAAYPNPARDLIRLVGGDQTQPVELVNALGQVVLQQAASRPALPVQGLPRGMYVVRQGSWSQRLVLE